MAHAVSDYSTCHVCRGHSPAQPHQEVRGAIYVAAAVLSAVLVASPAFLSLLVFGNWMLVFVRRCTLPLAMFVVVVFIGVLPKDGRLS